MDGAPLNAAEIQTTVGVSRGHLIFACFRKVLPDSYFKALKEDFQLVEKSRVFSLAVTTWLMIVQRLSGSGTLATAVSNLIGGQGRDLLDDCKRVREGNISAATGGFSQARQRMPAAAAGRIADHTFEQLSRSGQGGALRDRMFLLDGTSIRLMHTRSLVEAFPPARNQHGESHWPVLRVAVMHHVVTALAMAPEFGPMYGPAAVSEQALAEALVDRLPESSVLIGDRNFGVFSVAWHAHARGHQVLVRLSGPRLARLNGGHVDAPMEKKVKWTPSRQDLRAHPGLDPAASIEGRLIVARVPGKAELLYLFTTLKEPAETVTALYAERWHIETDLRALKKEVSLDVLTAKSPALAACELFLAVATWNLIRAVMSEAARQHGIEPRRISFSRARAAVEAFSWAVAEYPEDFQRLWNLLIRMLGQCKLPVRKRPPCPRAVWPGGSHFPVRTTSR